MQLADAISLGLYLLGAVYLAYQIGCLICNK